MMSLLSDPIKPISRVATPARIALAVDIDNGHFGRRGCFQHLREQIGAALLNGCDRQALPFGPATENTKGIFISRRRP